MPALAEWRAVAHSYRTRAKMPGTTDAEFYAARAGLGCAKRSFNALLARLRAARAEERERFGIQERKV